MAALHNAATYLAQDDAEEYAEALLAWELHPTVTAADPGLWVVMVPADELDRAREVRRRLLVGE